MATVHIETEVSITQLLQGVQQLDSATLEEFADEVLYLRAKRRASALCKNEADLLQKINTGLPLNTQKRFAKLKQKRDTENLSPSEHEELLAIVDQVEQRDVERLQALTELAQLRNVSVREVMNQLGLTRTDDA